MLGHVVMAYLVTRLKKLPVDVLQNPVYIKQNRSMKVMEKLCPAAEMWW